ncbi:anti-anti-sigma factor [Tabrizicola sp. TH137]|uniref:STAS domain-containing protein n=1 Tax=Tabrizicola sp. TH137 TaxID=2067452 RepID=UPI000C7DEBCE|nr:STAS domain-containing protein [Tabrizicola sp. TH137]PLL12630.1 anti-anti-sigma factor [Tabrizicola sp. TH137]
MAIKSKELSGDLRAGAAAELRDELAAALAKGSLRIKTAGLTAVDASIIQVLVAARATAAQMDRKLQIDMPEDGVLAAMLDRLAMGKALSA